MNAFKGLPSGTSSKEYKKEVQKIINRAPNTQVKKFIEAARELETDQSEENFDRVLKRVAKAPPPKDEKGKQEN